MADEVVGSMWVRLLLDSTGLKDEMEKTTASLTGWRDATNANTMELAKWGAAIAAEAAPFVAVAKAANDAAQAASRYGDKVHDLSIKTLLTEREVQRLQYAVNATGGDFDQAASSIAFLARNLQNAQDPTSRQAKALQQLGIEVLDSQGHVKSMSVMLPQIVDRLHNTSDATLRANLTMELFGRNTGEVAKMVEKGSTTLSAYGDEAERMGLIMTPEQLAVQQQFNEEWATMNITLQQLYVDLGTQIIPIMQELIPVVQEITPFLELLINTVGTLTNGFVSLAEAAQAAQSAVSGIMTGDFSAAQEHLGKAISAGARANQNLGEIGGLATGGISMGGEITATGAGTTGHRLPSGTATSKSKALYESRQGVTQVVNISATQQTPNQINAVVKAASQSLATSLRFGGG